MRWSDKPKQVKNCGRDYYMHFHYKSITIRFHGMRKENRDEESSEHR